MKKLLFVLFLLPLLAASQCPELIGKPLDNTKAFLKQVEEQLAVSLPDTEVQGENELITYSEDSRLYKFKISNKATGVHSVYVEAPAEKIMKLFSWIKEKYGSCNFTGDQQWMKFENVTIYWKNVSSKKRSIYISSNS